MMQDDNQPESAHEDGAAVDIDAQQAAAEVVAAPADPIEDLAREKGWRPKDDFRGNPDEWRDARDYIRLGMDRGRDANREMRELRQAVDRIGKTSEAVMRRTLEERIREAEQRYAGAHDRGDHKEAREAVEESVRLREELKTSPTPSVPPETQDWVSRNPWIQTDPAARAVALDVTTRLSQQGVSQAEQLAEAEKAVRARFPEHFGQRRDAKPAAAVSEPQSRTAQHQARSKGFNDLPSEAQKAAKDFQRRGMVKNLEDYAKAYFEEEAA